MKGLWGREGQDTVLSGACLSSREVRGESKSGRYELREEGGFLKRLEVRMSAEKEEMSIARKWRKVLVIGVVRV